MAQHAIYRAKFHVGANGATVYTAFIGLSGGSRKDGQNPTTAAAVLSAINSNLLNIIKEMGATSLATAPGGTVVLDSFEPASVPDCWE
jgi:hypothetical protein